MTERDSVKSTYHILAEALVYPNLKDPALMEYYGVVDMTDMPLAVFNRPGELSKVIDSVWKALGLRDNTDEDDKAAAKTDTLQRLGRLLGARSVATPQPAPGRV